MSQTTATSTSTRHPRARLLKALRSACLIAASSLTLALAITAAPAAAAGPEPPMPLNGIAASMPTIADVAGAGLLPSTSHLSGTARLRSPYPCADYAARGVAGTSHWGEWEAKSSEGNRVRVITFSYGDARIDTAWSKLKAAIAACPTVLARTDTGGPGITTQQIISTTADAVRFELTVRGPDGDRNVGEDRAIVYQRVDDAIQKVQVARRTVTDGDRSLLTRLTATTRARYVAARAGTGAGGDFEAALVAAAPPIGPLIGNAAYPGVEAVGSLAPDQSLNVSVGDSFISGEAGRWRGNVFWHLNAPRADALGSEAYWDTPTGEAIRGCHRAKGAEIHVPGTVGLNLACSGAITSSKFGGGDYKPGIDDGMVDPNTGAQMPGQLTFLGDIARSARIGTVVLSIGGNDMGFSSVIGSCVVAFMKPWPFTSHCADNPATRDRLSDHALAVVGDKVEQAIVRIHATMQAAGYSNGSWQLVVQNYPKPIATDNRYPETYAGRFLTGGCPFYDSDIRWVNSRLPALTNALASAARRAAASTGQPVRFLDVTDLFAGRELCAKGAGKVDKLPEGEIVSKAERVQSIQVFAPWVSAEAIHPNQLGQKALQACLRQALNGGVVRSGRCEAPEDWSEVDATGLPIVRFAPTI